MTGNNRSLTYLPIELIEYIAFYLDLKDRASLSLVNRRLNQLFKAILATEKLCISINELPNDYQAYLIVTDLIAVAKSADKKPLTGVHIVVRQLPWLSMTSPLMLAVKNGRYDLIEKFIDVVPGSYYSTVIAQLKTWKEPLDKDNNKKFQNLTMFNLVKSKIIELEKKLQDSDIKPKFFN